MKRDDGGKRGARKAGPSARPSGQRPDPQYNFYNPMARLDPGQMDVRPPGHHGHKRGKTPKQ